MEYEERPFEELGEDEEISLSRIPWKRFLH